MLVPCWNGRDRLQLDRVLDPENVGVSLDTRRHAAPAVDRKVRLELV